MLKVGCPWSLQPLLWGSRELGAELRGRFITWPHPALDFSWALSSCPHTLPSGAEHFTGCTGDNSRLPLSFSRS